MKGFTLWEPWASLVAQGLKRNETRSWSTRYRGVLAIHAAKTDRDVGPIQRIFDVGEISRFNRRAFMKAVKNGWPLGKVVAVVELVDCIPTEQAVKEGLTKMEKAAGDYSAGRFAWIFKNIRRVDPPIAWRGAQGLWNVPLDLESELTLTVSKDLL